MYPAPGRNDGPMRATTLRWLLRHLHAAAEQRRRAERVAATVEEPEADPRVAADSPKDRLFRELDCGSRLQQHCVEVHLVSRRVRTANRIVVVPEDQASTKPRQSHCPVKSDVRAWGVGAVGG